MGTKKAAQFFGPCSLSSLRSTSITMVMGLESYRSTVTVPPSPCAFALSCKSIFELSSPSQERMCSGGAAARLNDGVAA